MEKPGMGGAPFRRAGLLTSPLAGLAILWSLAAPLAAQSREPYWRNLPPALTLGREVRLALCLSGGNGEESPAPPPVPPMAVMEVLPPEGDEILALRVIPLEGPFFILPGFSFSLGPRTLRAPPLRIPVNPAPGEEPDIREGAEAPEEAPRPPWPPGLIRNRIGGRIQALWEEGRAAEALAELRRYERDHIAGFRLAAPRRELERLLRLEGEGDEIFRHPLFFIPLSLLCLILGALGLTLPRSLWRGRRFAGRACGAASLVFPVLALLCLLRLTTVRPLKGVLPACLGGRNPRQALALGAPMYRIPEEGASEILSLGEGQGLLVYETREGWAFAESLRDGTTGWIRAGAYIIY